MTALRVRRLVVAVVTVVALLALAFAADSIAAANVERTLAATARARDDLPADPDTYVGGFPFMQVNFTNEVPRISFEALDIDVEGVGNANSRTDIYDIKVDAAKARAGVFIGATAKRVEHTLSLDGVAFGQLLDMTDLDISNPYDISPSGGSAAEAQLTGTMPGTAEPVTVTVTLRLDGPTFRMEPIELIDVPSDLAPTARDHFTLELDTRNIPIGAQADMVDLAGGSIRFSAQKRNVELTQEVLSPVARPAQPAG